MHKGLISEFDYYFTYVNPNENKNCPYCGNLKKPISYSAMRSTCCSRECKSLFSRKGALSQIDSEGGVDVWHQKRINKRNELYPSLNSEIAVKMNNTLNENRRNNGFRSIEEAILYEAILKEFPDINIIPDDKRFFTSRKHRLADDGLNTILDFGFPDYCLNVEVDGGDGFFLSTGAGDGRGFLSRRPSAADLGRLPFVRGHGSERRDGHFRSGHGLQ
jgi:hypothetical protein